MSEYIEREALLAKSKPFRLGQGEQWTGGGIPRFIDVDDVKNAPAADVVPVVRGEWKQCFEDWRQQIEGDECSVCGFQHYGTSIGRYHYCPNCGAKMKGE